MENRAALQKLKSELEEGRYPFCTLLGDDFKEEVEEALQRLERTSKKKNFGGNSNERFDCYQLRMQRFLRVCTE